ncbi:MAG: 50S ribosomal protein L17 [Candidatus Omnitrophica bacterium]|nr:50S ribosomal protein L17 [Candidatus Omnitrophota bacterium]
MRHAKKRLQLGRFTSWHDATIISLAKNMVICQSIKTTLTRAKSSKQLIEKLITLGKKNTLFARRQAQKILGEHKLVNILFNEIAPRFSKRNSGFTRIIGLGKRRGDNAEMVIFELTELKKKEPKKQKAAKEAKAQETLEDNTQVVEKKPVTESKKETRAAIKDNPIDEKKPQKKFMGGLRTIFKKKSDSL